MNKPMMRFDGYDEDWEKVKLGEMGFYISDGNYGNLYPKQSEFVDSGVPFIRVNAFTNDGYLSHNDLSYISTELHSKLLSGHLVEGDILITTRGEIGKIAYVDNSFDGANINAQICLIRCNDVVSNLYLHEYLQKPNVQSQIKGLQTGSALKQLPKGNLDKVTIVHPKSEEQEQIGIFFKTLDDLISAEEETVEAYERYKEGMLQKMFPKKGKNFPEVRFGGFDDEWEEKKLGDVFDKISEGSTPPTKNRDNYIGGNIPFANISDLVNKYVYNTESYITDTGLSNSSTWLVPENSILLSTGATIGEVSITRSKITTKQGIMGMVPSCGCDVEFLYTLFKTVNFQNTLNRTSNTGTFASVPKGSLESIKLILPSKEEQEFIGNFFKTFDDIIESHKEKLGIYQQMKESLLQKMFV